MAAATGVRLFTLDEGNQKLRSKDKRKVEITYIENTLNEVQ